MDSINKGGRPPKQQKGLRVWVSDSQVSRVLKIVEAGNRLDEFNKALAAMRSPSEALINVLNNEYDVIGTKNLLSGIDALLFGVDTVAPHSLQTPITHAKPTETTQDAPIYKQTDFVELVEDAQAETVPSGYDNSLSINKNLALLLGVAYDSNDKKQGSSFTRMKKQAKETLGSDATDLAIYQFHLNKKA